MALGDLLVSKLKRYQGETKCQENFALGYESLSPLIFKGMIKNIKR
jgi:hypothetical protein